MTFSIDNSTFQTTLERFQAQLHQACFPGIDKSIINAIHRSSQFAPTEQVDLIDCLSRSYYGKPSVAEILFKNRWHCSKSHKTSIINAFKNAFNYLEADMGDKLYSELSSKYVNEIYVHKRTGSTFAQHLVMGLGKNMNIGFPVLPVAAFPTPNAKSTAPRT